jgi:hypothetical protein
MSVKKEEMQKQPCFSPVGGYRVTAKASLDKLILEKAAHQDVNKRTEEVKEEIPVLEQFRLMSIYIDNLETLVETLKERIKVICYDQEVISERDPEKMPEVCEFAQVLITYNCRLVKLNERLRFLLESLQI